MVKPHVPHRFVSSSPAKANVNLEKVIIKMKRKRENQ